MKYMGMVKLFNQYLPLINVYVDVHIRIIKYQQVPHHTAVPDVLNCANL